MAAISSSTILLGQSEREYILAGCRQDCRLDGRTCHEIRPYVLVQQSTADNPNSDTAPLILSHGSARLLSANSCHDGESTQLLCSIKAELVQPAQDCPNHGAVEFHVDTLAAGISRRLCDDLQATLTHLLASSRNNGSSSGNNHGIVDTSALCVLPGVYAWRLQIDVYIVSHAGSLLDAASRVIRAALQTTKLPTVEVLPTTATATTSHESQQAETTTTTAAVMVDGDYHHASYVPGVERGPLIVTVTVLQSSLDTTTTTTTNHRPVTCLVLDATAAEEACATAQVHVAVVPGTAKDDKTPTITAVRKTGTGSLPVALLPEITKLALQQASKVDTADDAFVRKTSTEPAATWLLQGLYDLQ